LLPPFRLPDVDRSTLLAPMVESTKTGRVSRKQPRQIVGFSLEPAMAREVKTHAAKNGLTLRKLFEEIWQTYKKRGGRP
jgi:hypothetical protein